MPDTQGKPTYPRQDCPACKQHKTPGKCWDCKKKIPAYLNVPEGYLSPVPDHFHFAEAGGIQALRAVMQVLCQKCYLVAFKEAYPDAEPPKFAE